ncbi:MAG: universal stress protein, partial [Rhodobacteraceae bacterium]
MYSTILIPTDGSELANKAVEHGSMLAKQLGSSVVIVTVTEIWSSLEMAAEVEHGNQTPVQVFETAAKTAAEEILREAKAIAKANGVDAATVAGLDRQLGVG